MLQIKKIFSYYIMYTITEVAHNIILQMEIL